MAEIAAAEPLAVADLEVCRAAGGAWVAVEAWDRPVAYLLSSIVDGCAHIEQVRMAATSARRPMRIAVSVFGARANGS
jgi:hypothetical protein